MTRRRLRRLPVILVVTLVIAGLGLGSSGVLRAWALDRLVRVMSYQQPYTDDDLLVVLAIGSDQGPPHRPGDPLRARADGIHLLVVDTRTDRMTVIDIPRDSAIGGGKVNAHLVLGGPERLEAQLEAWSGLAIDYWALGSFWSLEAVTAGLGGIEVNVPRRMNDPFSGSDLQPGFQRLSPVQALAFGRDRKSLPDGDIGRSRNQGAMLISVLQQMRNEAGADLGRVSALVALFQRSTVSNIPAGQLLPLAYRVLRIDPTAISQVTISGPFGTIGGGSVIYPQPGDTFSRLLNGQVGP